ncbi:3-oxoacyl-ACP reductase [Sesbania bispinosa]|nr:3-oxoacyl-ACP reductase [Sesbania bispinosa]
MELHLSAHPVSQFSRDNGFISNASIQPNPATHHQSSRNPTSTIWPSTQLYITVVHKPTR